MNVKKLHYKNQSQFKQQIMGSMDCIHHFVAGSSALQHFSSGAVFSQPAAPWLMPEYGQMIQPESKSLSKSLQPWLVM